MNLKSHPVYRRILLKLSGEASLGKQSSGVDGPAIHHIVDSVKTLVDIGVEVAIVIGGGNFLRGAALTQYGFNRVTCDHMGMLATVMNGLVLRDGFREASLPVNVVSSLGIPGIVDVYQVTQVQEALKRKEIIIFVGGTGCPLFSTDSAASLRAIEIQADIILKATKVDGVYSADPKKDQGAQLFQKLTFQEVIDRKLQVMDLTAM